MRNANTQIVLISLALILSACTQNVEGWVCKSTERKVDFSKDTSPFLMSATIRGNHVSLDGKMSSGKLSIVEHCAEEFQGFCAESSNDSLLVHFNPYDSEIETHFTLNRVSGIFKYWHVDRKLDMMFESEGLCEKLKSL
jgi:hypothetical protein